MNLDDLADPDDVKVKIITATVSLESPKTMSVYAAWAHARDELNRLIKDLPLLQRVGLVNVARSDGVNRAIAVGGSWIPPNNLATMPVQDAVKILYRGTGAGYVGVLVLRCPEPLSYTPVTVVGPLDDVLLLNRKIARGHLQKVIDDLAEKKLECRHSLR